MTSKGYKASQDCDGYIETPDISTPLCRRETQDFMFRNSLGSFTFMFYPVIMISTYKAGQNKTLFSPVIGITPATEMPNIARERVFKYAHSFHRTRITRTMSRGYCNYCIFLHKYKLNRARRCSGSLMLVLYLNGELLSQSNKHQLQNNKITFYTYFRDFIEIIFLSYKKCLKATNRARGVKKCKN